MKRKYLNIENPTIQRILKEREDATEIRGSKGKGVNRADTEDCLEFFVTLVFQNSQQLQEFFEAIQDKVPILFNSYADGVAFAEHFRIKVTPSKREKLSKIKERKNIL